MENPAVWKTHKNMYIFASPVTFNTEEVAIAGQEVSQEMK